MRSALILSLVLVGCASAPPHKMIEEAYFKCDASKTLEGGIYGKGPFMRFGPHPASCSTDEWVRLDRTEFKTLASSWYAKDWKNEIPFWSRDGN